MFLSVRMEVVAVTAEVAAAAVAVAEEEEEQQQQVERHGGWWANCRPSFVCCEICSSSSTARLRRHCRPKRC